jgi:hypothetical protein
MSHLLTEYAKSCGVKIDKPYNNPHFYPLPFDKYVVIHASSGMESKNYDYYNDVIELLKPFLDKNKIGIIQIGGEKDIKLRWVHYSLGTTKLQMQYIIQNSELVLCNDTCSAHFASGFGKKIVALYSVLYKRNAYPYWSKNEDFIQLEADRKGKSPSFCAVECPKTIDTIKIEDVAKSVLKLLNIENNISIKTIFVGEKYPRQAIEIVPNFQNNIGLSNKLLNIRLDYCENFDFLYSWLKNNKASLVINKTFGIEKIIPFKQNIESIVLDISDMGDAAKKQIEDITKFGFKLIVISRNKEKIQEQRFNLFDFNVELVENKKVENVGDVYSNNFFAKTGKVILSNSKKYISKAHLDKDLPANINNSPINSPDFWDDSDYMAIFSK